MEFFHKQVEDGTICIMGYRGDEENVIIPDNYGKIVSTIYDEVFRDHKELKSVTIPDTVTSLGEYLFEGCENLRTLKLPDELQFLWGATFAESGLEEIVLPDKLTTIPSYAFKNCKNLKKVVCGKGLKKVYSWAFEGCDALTEVIYNSEVDVSQNAFKAKEI